MFSLKTVNHEGTRLREEARNVFLEDKSISSITEMTIDQSFAFFIN